MRIDMCDYNYNKWFEIYNILNDFNKNCLEFNGRHLICKKDCGGEKIINLDEQNCFVRAVKYPKDYKMFIDHLAEKNWNAAKIMAELIIRNLTIS